jgi:hypothetical protein
MTVSDSVVSRRCFLKLTGLTGMAAFSGIQGMARFTGVPDIAGYIKAAYRLLDSVSLLNLEFYFIGVKEPADARQQWLEATNPDTMESYMLVRLPQQHIAEEYIDLQPAGAHISEVQTRIAGYSYLVFRIYFTGNNGRNLTGKDDRFSLTQKNLLDWNAPYLKLIVREDWGIDRPLFSPYQPDINQYPLGYGGGVFAYNRFPKAPVDNSSTFLNPRPVTAIEAPYRLILSPELPNHQYIFRWYFSDPADELWMATLKVMPNPDRAVIALNGQSDKKKTIKSFTSLRSKFRGRKSVQIPASSQAPHQLAQPNSASPVGEQPMGLAIIGSGDEQDVSRITDVFTSLPSGPDPLSPDSLSSERLKLVKLYFLNRAVLKAYTKKMSLTALGVSSLIEFQNTLYKEIVSFNPTLSIYQWKQWMSFGRDQEVQIVRQVKDLCLGHTMLYIIMTKRRTQEEVSFLDYTEYLMPLEHEKDYTRYNDEDKEKYAKEGYKYNTPFKTIRFANFKPKRIKPVYLYPKSNLVRFDSTLGPLTVRKEENKDNFIAFWPLNPLPDGSNAPDSFLEWEYIATDWQGKESLISRKLYVVSSRFAVPSSQSESPIFIPDTSAIKSLSQNLRSQSASSVPTCPLADVEKQFHTAVAAIASKSEHWHLVYLQSEQYLMEKADCFRTHIENIFDAIKGKIQAVYDSNKEWVDGQGDVEEAIQHFQNVLYARVQQEMQPINERIAELKERAKTIIDNTSVKINDAQKELVNAIYHYAALPGAYYDELMDKVATPAVVAVNAEITALKSTYDALKARMINIDNEIDGFLQTLPASLNVASDLKKMLCDIKEAYYFIEHTESQCKSRVNAFKNNIGISVHKVELDFEKAGEALRQKIGSEWETVHKKADDYYHKANRDISNIKTEALIFKSNIRTATVDAGKKAMDFFHYDATRQQLHSLTGFVGKINETVQKEVAVRLSIAETYLKSQTNDAVLSVENNVNQVFAKINVETKMAIKGAMRNIGSELGGMVNPEIASDLLSYYHDVKSMAQDVQNEITNDLQQVKESKKQLEEEFNKEWEGLKASMSKQIDTLQHQYGDAKKQVEDYMETQKQYFQDQFNRQKNKLVLITKDAQAQVRSLENQARDQAQNVRQQALDLFKGLESKIAGSIKLKDILHIDTCLPKMNKTNKSLYYEFITTNFLDEVSIGTISIKLKDKGKNLQARLVCYFEKSLIGPNKYLSQTRLENFVLSIFSGRLDIEFKQLEIISSESIRHKTNVQIGNVSFKKELGFLEALSKNIKVPGTGIVLNILPDAVVASYTYGFPGISGGAFTMTNLKFNVGVKVPFPTGGPLKPIRVSLGINSADDQFVIAVSIFGGRGHFVLETTPRYISKIDCGLEFGGYLGLSLGIAQGQAYLMAGMRYVFSRNDVGKSSMHFYGYLTCGGSITVFGFITISVCFLLCLEYEKQSDGSSSLTGSCTLTLSVKIGFFEKSFSLTFKKTIAGSDSKSASSAFLPHFHTEDESQYAVFYPAGSEHYLSYTDFPDPDAPKRKWPSKQSLFTEEGWVQFCKSFCYE